MDLFSLWRAKAQLQADRQVPYADRLARDQQFASRAGPIPARRSALARWVQAWVAAQESVAPAHLAEVSRVLVLLPRLAVVLGLLLGFGAASAALAYSGDSPVNLLVLFGLLLLLPSLFLLISLLVVLTGGAAAGAMSVSPAHWLAQWSQRYLDAADMDWRHATLQRYARWQYFYLSQWFGIGFYLAALLCVVLFVTLSDMAFGWSTTLSLASDSVARFVSATALPWFGLWADAVPSAELVEVSRFVRLESAAVDRATAQQLGTWWPYILMMLLAYGLLPRVLLLGLAQWRAREALTQSLLQDGEVQALLDRMRMQSLRRDAIAEEAGSASPADQSAVAIGKLQGGATALVIWNAVCAVDEVSADLLARYGISRTPSFSLDVRQSAEERAATLQEISAAGAERIVLLTKGWEPPVLEVKDLLVELAESAPTASSIAVLPLATHLQGVETADQLTWARALRSMGERGVHVLDAIAGHD